MVECLTWDQDVGGSNPLTLTNPVSSNWQDALDAAVEVRVLAPEQQCATIQVAREAGASALRTGHADRVLRDEVKRGVMSRLLS